MKYNISEHTGYRLATITEKSTSLFVVHITIDIHKEQTVTTHATELIYADALLSGAGKYDRSAFLDAVNKLGASIQVTTAQGQVHITIKGMTKHSQKLLGLFKTMIESPKFSNSELERIKVTTKNELHEAQDDSKSISHSNLVNLFYDKRDRHYTPKLSSTSLAVEYVSRKELTNLHKIVLSNLWNVSATSDKNTLTTINKALNGLRGGAQLLKSSNFSQAKTVAGKIEFADIPSKSNIDINFGAPVPITLRHPDYIPLMFGLSVLAKWGGFSGRLMSTVREKEGLTYGIYGTLEGFLYNKTGYWRVMSFFAPEKVQQGITSTMREFKKIHKNGITKTEFNNFKVILNTQQTLLGDSVYKLLKDLHVFHCQGFTIHEIEAFKSQINTLTRSQVNKAIKMYLDPNQVNLSCAGPIKKVRKLISQSLK